MAGQPPTLDVLELLIEMHHARLDQLSQRYAGTELAAEGFRLMSPEAIEWTAATAKRLYDRIRQRGEWARASKEMVEMLDHVLDLYERAAVIAAQCAGPGRQRVCEDCGTASSLVPTCPACGGWRWQH
jgi:hypothetical protein